jgi:sugar phosphate isomerase/epimerase
VSDGRPVIAINTLAWHGHDMEVAFAEIAAIGARAVEPALISTYYPEMTDDWFSPASAARLAGWAQDNGLAIHAVGAHMDLGLPGARASFRRRIDLAGALGARFIHTNTTRRARERDFLAALEALIPKAEAAGVTICLENPGEGADNIVPDGTAGARLIERIGSPRVWLNYDFSNAYSYSRGLLRPERDYAAAFPWAAHLHLKDIERRGASWRFTALGQGVTDYDTVLRDLASCGGVPPLAIELPLRHHRAPDWAIALAPGAPPVPLAEIRSVMERSLRFVTDRLATGQAAPAPFMSQLRRS